MATSKKIRSAQGHPQASFTLGEIAPSLYGRIDFDGYYKALRTCRNMIVSKYGGAYNRPGSEFVGEVNNSTNKAYLFKFDFNNTQQYVLEFGNYTMRIIANGALVMSDSALPLVVVTPWAIADVPLLKMTQSADVITVCHPAYPTYQIQRYTFVTNSHNRPPMHQPIQNTTEWRIVLYENVNGPFQDINIDETALISVSSVGLGSTTTVTCTQPIFTEDMVGLEFYIQQSDKDITLAWGVNESKSVGQIVVYGENYYKSLSSGTTGTLPPTHTLGTKNDGAPGILWQYLHSGFGIVKITEFISTTVITGTVISTLPDSLIVTTPVVISNVFTAAGGYPVVIGTATPHGYSSGQQVFINNIGSTADGISGTWIIDVANDTFFYLENNWGTGGTLSSDPTVSTGAASYLWALPAWGSSMGYPATSSYFQDRQIFGGCPGSPSTMDLSRTSGFLDFGQSNPLLDDDGIRLKLLSNQVNAIKHFIDLKYLIVLTNGGIYRINGGQNGGNVITPSTINFNSENAESVSDVPPIKISNYALFVQEKGTQIRTVGYNFAEDAFTGEDLTEMSNHLLQFNTILRWAYQDIPCACVWSVRDDGVLLGLTFVPKQQVAGWHHHDTVNGEYEDVCCVTEQDQITGFYEDVVYMIVNRGFNAWIEQPTNISGVTLSNPVCPNGIYTLKFTRS